MLFGYIFILLLSDRQNMPYVCWVLYNNVFYTSINEIIDYIKFKRLFILFYFS